MRKKIIIICLFIVGLLGLLILVANTDRKDKLPIAEAEKGVLQVVISSTGEIKPTKQVNIEVSNLVAKLRIYKATIADMVPEGTIVNKGDYIATLKKDELQKSLEKYNLELEELEREIELKKIDTIIQLKGLREQIEEQKHIIEEAEIKLEYSIYEPPATQRKSKIEVDNAKRNYDQKERNYVANKANAELRMSRFDKNKEKLLERIDEINQLIKAYTIKAPSSGMVTYVTFRRRGEQKKRQTGDDFWVYYDRVVATLPDLSEMVSITYINETDISKVTIGQDVIVTTDAYNDIELKGKIKSIANIGELQSGTEAKVFEVVISIKEIPEGFRPGMTTSNKILLREYNDVVYIPIEAVHIDDKSSFVYINGMRITKQYIETGDSNDDNIIITSGLNAGEEVLLVTPEDLE